MIPNSSGASMPVSARARSSTARAASISSTRRHHRQHHLDRVLGGDAQDRAQLGREHVGALERRAGSRGRRGTGSPRAASAAPAAACRRPASSVRTTSGRPSSATAISRRVSACSSSSGSSARSRNRNSVRSRPTPSAPSSTARGRLAGRAQVGEHLDPGAVAGARRSRARARARARACGRRARGARSRRAATSAEGSTWRVPASPSISTVVPSAIPAPPRRARPRPGARARGRGSRRARWRCRARWRSRSRSAGSSAAASAGVSSPAITIAGSYRWRSRRLTGQRADHPPADVEHVRRALLRAAVPRAPGSASATCTAASYQARSAVAPRSIAA